MKILYLAPLPIDLLNLDGVPKKIIDQADSYVTFGLSVDIISYYNHNTILIDAETKITKILGKGNSKFDVIRIATSLANSYDAFYVRYSKSDFFFLRFLRKVKTNPLKKVVVEIPTFPYDNQGNENVKGKCIEYIDKLYRTQLHKYVDRIVTFTGEQSIFGVKTINTINGFDFSKISPINDPIDVRKQVSLIAVSAMFVLHGYDRLINGLVYYYKNGGKRNIVLHLIGQGPSIGAYKKLVKENNLENNVIFHGKVFGKKLYNLYSGVAAGINSLAIHRENLKKESTLKTKEYSAMGLPIVSSSYVDAFSIEGNKNFVFTVQADESYVDIEALLSFIDRIYKDSSVAEVHNLIRKDAIGVCDIHVTTKPIFDFYVENKQN